VAQEPTRQAPTSDAPTRSARAPRFLFLTLLSLGVFLAGLELMVTAVALPAIIGDPSIGDWTQLRRASWIINGYLLAFVTAIPLAGRASDRFGTRRPLIVALALFTLGSALAGRAQTLDELIAARVLQGLGGGALVPLATAGASHLFAGLGRPRAVGLVTAMTFLGMAAGPFVGASVLQLARFDALLRDAGVSIDAARILVPAWRWVFYLNVPLGILGLLYAWALGVDTPRGHGRVDPVGAALFAVGLAAGLAAITWAGAPDLPGGAAGLAVLVLVSIGALALAALRGRASADPFFDISHFHKPAFASAVLLSLLTGYALATAIVGAAVFVDRVLYGGPETQQVALGALAGATALGALASGLIGRRISHRALALAGLALSGIGLWRMSGWTPDVELGRMVPDLALFGFGFGATVTPRAIAAVEALGAAAFGAAAAAVTVARMVGMAVGLAVLTQLGSNRIDALARIVADPVLRDTILPPELQGQPLQNALVVAALERWAAGEAADIMSALFVVALGVTLVALVPAWGLSSRSPGGEPGSPRRDPRAVSRGSGLGS
jgi:MFS family permease